MTVFKNGDSVKVTMQLRDLKREVAILNVCKHPHLLPLPSSHHVRHGTSMDGAGFLRVDWAIPSMPGGRQPGVCALRGLQCPVLGGGLRSLMMK